MMRSDFQDFKCHFNVKLSLSPFFWVGLSCGQPHNTSHVKTPYLRGLPKPRICLLVLSRDLFIRKLQPPRVTKEAIFLAYLLKC